jgi:hypothetical protein
MRRSLIALAAAGIVASGVAGANGFASRVDHAAPSGYVAVQERHYYGDRWDDDRRFSVDEREQRLMERIRNGRDRGALTRWEARQLRDDLLAIQSKERIYRQDGRIDGAERDDLHRELDRVAWNLRAQLRDEERRF